MRIKTNLPKAIVYREAEQGREVPLSFKPNALPSSDDFIKVIYAGGYFAAIGMGGSIAYSREGQTWTARKLGDYELWDIDYIKNEYVITGKCDVGGLIMSSTDLAGWTVRAKIDSAAVFMGVWHNGENYIVIGRAQDPATSRWGIKAYVSKDLASFEATVLHDYSKYMASEYLKRSPQVLKGNNRIGVAMKESDGGETLVYTSDGYSCSKVDARTTAVMSVKFPAIFCDGYFWQLPNSDGHGIMRSINLNEWEKVNIGYSLSGVPYSVCAVHLNDRILFITQREGLFLRDGESLGGTAKEDYFTISPSAVINHAACSGKRVVCVCNGGVILTANMDITDMGMEVEPSLADYGVYLRKSDNIRMLRIKAVTSSIDPNIRPENIKKGITVLGITGTYGG